METMFNTAVAELPLGSDRHYVAPGQFTIDRGTGKLQLRAMAPAALSPGENRICMVWRSCGGKYFVHVIGKDSAITEFAVSDPNESYVSVEVVHCSVQDPDKQRKDVRNRCI